RGCGARRRGVPLLAVRRARHEPFVARALVLAERTAAHRVAAGPGPLVTEARRRAPVPRDPRPLAARLGARLDAARSVRAAAHHAAGGPAAPAIGAGRLGFPVREIRAADLEGLAHAACPVGSAG